MKKLLCVVAAAALPLACGSVPTEPTPTPTAVSPPADETFASAARGAPTCSEQADWSVVRGAVLEVVASGREFVTLQARLLLADENARMPCFTTAFAVRPSGRGIDLLTARDGRRSTLTAPPGRYLVTATVVGSGRPPYTAEIAVRLPSGN